MANRMDLSLYWKYKCDELKDSINDLFGPREYKSTPPKLVVSYKCKKEDLTELITQVLTENAYIISVIKPMVKQLHTKTSLHDVYKGLEENINIIIDLDKRFADITLNTIFQHISVLTNNMLNCMNLKESLRICLDEQDPRISHICWNCEGYINHLQVLISLLSSAVMKPLVFCKSEPFMLTERPPRQVIKAIQKRPYYRGNQDYEEHGPQRRNYMLRESSSETPRTSYSDLNDPTIF